MARICIVQQRWGEDDIPGRIIESAEAKDWRTFGFRPLRNLTMRLGREIGESLWPSRWPLVELERQKIAMGSRAFGNVFARQSDSD